MRDRLPRARRIWIFVALCVAAALFAGGYAFHSTRPPAGESTGTTTAIRLTDPPPPPFLMVRSTARESFRKLVLVPLAAPTGPAYETDLQCERAYFAANRGVCLTVDEFTQTNYAHIFDERFVRLHRITLTGIPSRTRVSRDGRRAAITVFETGHSYAQAGFSTRTTILDTATGQIIGDLEQFTIWRDGKRFKAVDFNLWGLTFKRDGNGFFATLASGGMKYLIEGDIDAREARVLRTGVECPSLSPDNSTLVYKDLKHDWGFWQLRALNLQTGEDIALTTETRSVDDQVDWLDNDHVLYHITGARGADVIALNRHGMEPPRILREYSYSPAVVRP